MSNKKKIIIAIIIIILIILFWFIFLTENFYEYSDKLYERLQNDNVEDGNIDSKYYDSKYGCINISYNNGIIEFFGCEISNDNVKDYCIHDGDELNCFEGNLDIDVTFKKDSEGVTNQDVNISLEKDDIYDYKYCVTENEKCNPDTPYQDNININKEGIYKVCIIASNGDTKTSEIVCSDEIIIDKTAPIITDLIISGEKGNNGWYKSDVYITDAVVTDNMSNIKEVVIDKTEVIGNTNSTIVTVTATDDAENVSTKEFEIKIDKTKPLVGEIIIDGEKGNNGWYKSDLLISKTDGTDLLSGHDKTVVNINKIDFDTSSQIITITTTDIAGNVSEESVEVKVDKTKPVIEEPTVIGTKGLNDWYVSDVSIELNEITDNLSLIDKSSVSNDLINYDTSLEKVIITATDMAGNITTKEIELKVDITKPIVGELVISGTTGLNGWYKSYVDLTYIDGSDSTSGHFSTKIDVEEINFDTVGETVTITTTDIAGNTSTSEVTVKVDTTLPTISGISDIFVLAATSFDILNEVEAEDATSTLDALTTSVNSINTNFNGNYYVEYKAIDMAGNTFSYIRKVIVSDQYPAVFYSVLNNPFTQYGWSNQDVIVGLVFRGVLDSDVISAKYCTTTGVSCIPTTDVNMDNQIVVLTEESATNKICSIAKLENGIESEVMCSDVYKIDKTAPIAGNIIIDGDTGLNSWYTSDLEISYTQGNDTLSGYNISSLSATKINYDTSSEKIYLTTYDKAGNKSVTSQTVKVDKTNPYLLNTQDIKTVINGSIDLILDVAATDAMSLVNGTFTVDSSDLDLTSEGTYNILYTVVDNAGNSKTYTRLVYVTNSNINITYSTFNSSVTSYGWSNRDMYIQINHPGTSSYNIDEIKYCTTTDDMCTPDKNPHLTYNRVLLQEESATNKVCSQIILKNGDMSNVICSGVYKIDKTAPVINEPILSGIEGLNGWYKSDVTISSYSAYDNLSGVRTTYIPTTKVVGETKSTIITITATDKAGNNSIYNLEVKIDKTAPTAGSLNIEGEMIDGWYGSDLNITALNGTDLLSGHLKTTIDFDVINASTSGTEVKVTTTDNAGNTSSIVEVLKIDKNLPVVGTLELHGTLGENNWYISDVTIGKLDSIDNTTEVEIIELKNDTAGTTLAVIQRDIYGVEKIETIHVKIDKYTPTLTLKEPLPRVYVGDDIDVISLFEEPVYGISGGTTTCGISNTSNLEVGTHTTTCTIKGNNGLKTTKEVTFDVIEKSVDGVTFIDGVKTTTNSYVVTDILPGSNTKIDTDFTINTTKGDSVWVFSSRIGYQNQMFGIAYNRTENLMQYNNLSYDLGGTKFPVGDKNSVSISMDGLYYNGIKYADVTDSYWQSNHKLYIFANNEAGRVRGTTNGQVTIHDLQVWQDDILVLDLKPAIMSDGEVVLFDMVSLTPLDVVGELVAVN